MSSVFKANRGLMLAFAAMVTVSAVAVAQTTGSPFASNKKKQAWETDVARPDSSTPTYQAPTYQAPLNDASQSGGPRYMAPPNYTAPADMPEITTSTAPTAPVYKAPSDPKPAYTAPSAPSAPPQNYNPPSTPSYGSYQSPAQNTSPATGGNLAPDLLPGFRARPTGQAGAYYPGREDKGGFSVPARAPRGLNQNGPIQRAPNTAPINNARNYSGANAAPQYRAPYQGGSVKSPQSSPPAYGGPNARPQYGYQSWKDRLGLGNLLTTMSVALKVGAAAVQRKNTVEDDGWNAGFIADGKVSGEVSAITRGGLEYGVGGEIRGQYDKYRRGFGGKVGDCGTGVVDFVPGCNSVLIDGLAQPLRGHTSQFYSAGLDNAKEAEFALEGAYVFLRSAYGDVTLGRDDGAAYLFSLGAPTLLAVNASNSPVDYTGLDSVRTVNEASGFAEKIAYVSPRLLGDQVGLGVQIGASYAPNARACGVDYCVRSNGKDASTALSPDLKDVLEFGLALDRTFANGLSVEGTATYAMASEDSQIAGFDDLKSLGFGLEAKYGPWTLGGSFLNSNNGLQNGDYEAYDVGLTFKPAQWGVSASYGHATDKNVNLMSDQATLGFVYDFERFTLGTGVQYIERDVVGLDGGLLAPRKEKATALFIEGGVKF